jgi:hypothetical protein
MALYTLFLFRDGELVAEFEPRCGDDLDALAAARAFSMDYAVEVYSESRFVARVRQDDELPNVNDAESA